MQHYDIQQIYTLVTRLNRQIINIEQIPNLRLMKVMWLRMNFQLQLALDYSLVISFFNFLDGASKLNSQLSFYLHL